MMGVCSFWRVCEFGNKARVRHSMCTTMKLTRNFTTRQNQRKKKNKTTSTKNREEEKKGLRVVCGTTLRDSRGAAGRTAHTQGKALEI